MLGKGYGEPVAMEGALKLKEMTYIHAEGYSGGALKHGPFALIEGDDVSFFRPKQQLVLVRALVLWSAGCPCVDVVVVVVQRNKFNTIRLNV